MTKGHFLCQLWILERGRGQRGTKFRFADEDYLLECQRGRGRLKRLVVKTSIKMFKDDIVRLQESKINSMEDSIVRHFWSGKSIKWIALDANGSSGGILMLRNSCSVEVKNWWADSIFGFCCAVGFTDPERVDDFFHLWT